MRWGVALVCLVACIFSAGMASAFGLRTHLWIGQRIVEDAKRDCSFVMAGVQTRMPADTCRAIREHSGAFLAGTLGPDAFPDVITGQVTTHPGLDGDWQTNDWLRHLLTTARTDEELAFAVGYAVHAAADMFAHTYVNAYAGDIFILGDERAVELRHVMLEKYIDYRLPAGMPSPQDMRVPATFLRDALIYNEDAARTGAASGFAVHIAGMYAVRLAVGGLERDLEDLEAKVSKALADIIVSHVDLQAKAASGEASLAAAEAALKLNQGKLDIESRAVGFAQQMLDHAKMAVERNIYIISWQTEQARIAHEATEAARTTHNTLVDQVAALKSSLAYLTIELASTPTDIVVRNCRVITSPTCDMVCGLLPFCEQVCNNVGDEVCDTATQVNETWKSLTSQVADVYKQVTDAEASLQKSTADLAAKVKNEVFTLDAKARFEAAQAGLDATYAAAKVTLEAAKLRHDAELGATNTAKELVANVKAEVASLRRSVIDTEALRTGLQDLFDSTDLLSGYAKNWRAGLDLAGEHYILTSLDVSKRLVSGEGGVLSAWADWLKCYGSAYTPVPYQVGTIPCEVEAFYEEIQSEVDKVIDRNLPDPFLSLYRQFTTIKAEIQLAVKREVEKAALDLAKLASPDASTREFIDLLVHPETASADRLRDVFSKVGDADGKALLVIPDVTRLIDKDIGLTDGKLDPARFSALKHALTLSRLALLDAAEVRRLAGALGANPAEVIFTEPPTRFSILLETVRSIDGNHQWQPYGLPYPRSDGSLAPATADKRHYGYGPRDNGPRGLPLFVNPNLRRIVFAALFPGGVGGDLMNQPELQWPRYRFPECAHNPFPLAFQQSNGDPAASDATCSLPPQQ